MKTKHKLKLLEELRIKISSTIDMSNKGLNMSSEYNRILDELITESKTVDVTFTAKPEPIQETKDPEPERFEIGEEVEVISNTCCHDFKIGEKVTIIAWMGDCDNPNKSYYTCVGSNDKTGLNGVLPNEIKKLPKPTINKEELRKHLEAAYKLWNKPPFGRASLIDKYLETL